MLLLLSYGIQALIYKTSSLKQMKLLNGYTTITMFAILPRRIPRCFQIVTLLTGDQEFDSPKTLAAFALGLMLFTVTLLLNIFALHIVKKYREQYE